MLSSHFLVVAQAKLLLIQEESAGAKSLRSPKYFWESKYKNYSPTTEEHQPLGGMQELFNSVQEHFPAGLDRSFEGLCMPNWNYNWKQEAIRWAPTFALVWVGLERGSTTYPSTTPLL